MDTEALAATRVGQVVIRGLGAAMESRVRYRFFPPDNILRGADILPGQTVLEVGCGTGFYTIPGSPLVGDGGSGSRWTWCPRRSSWSPARSRPPA